VWDGQDGNCAVSASEDGMVRWWDLRTLRQTAELKVGEDVGSMELAHGGGTLCVTSGKNVIFLDIARYACLPDPAARPPSPSLLDFDPIVPYLPFPVHPPSYPYPDETLLSRSPSHTPQPLSPSTPSSEIASSLARPTILGSERTTSTPASSANVTRVTTAPSIPFRTRQMGNAMQVGVKMVGPARSLPFSFSFSCSFSSFQLLL
jgi:hypothetical protein